MARPAVTRRSLIVSLFLTIAISLGAFATTFALGWGPKLGLDLAGGLSVVYKPAGPATTQQLDEVVTILNNRINGLGVSGAEVYLQGHTVVVSAPGVKNGRGVPEGKAPNVWKKSTLSCSTGMRKRIMAPSAITGSRWPKPV